MKQRTILSTLLFCALLLAGCGTRPLADGEAYLALGADRLGASALVGEARKQG